MTHDYSYLENRKGRVEIIPMIDIMLFLLVFFIMVTIQMIPAQGMPGNMPTSSTTVQLPKPKWVVILHQDGSILVENRPLTLAALRARLAAGNPARTQVTIVSDKHATTQALMNVMDACREAGVSDIGLAAKPES